MAAPKSRHDLCLFRPFMKLKNAWWACALAAGLALPAGDVAWAISHQGPTFAWPGLDRQSFLALAAALGLAWCCLQALGWRLAFGFNAKSGLRIGALSLLPCTLGLAWELIVRVHLPPPHDFPGRNLQILMAAQLISCLWA